MKSASSLGNLEESFRPFLGRIVSTDGVHGSTRVRRKPEGDYGIVHPLHCRFAGNRRTSLVPRWIQPGAQRKAQTCWFVDTNGKQRDESRRQRKPTIIAFPDRLSMPTIQRCTIPKIRFLEPAHSCRTHDVARLPGAHQFIRVDIWNIPFEFRDSENGVCRTTRSEHALATVDSKQPVTQTAPKLNCFGRG